MSERIVWAYKPLPALNNETGFVVCDEALAKKLIASGDAQDTAIGANHFKEIQAAAPVVQTAAVDEYDTKVLTPRKRSAKAAE